MIVFLPAADVIAEAGDWSWTGQAMWQRGWGSGVLSVIARRCAIECVSFSSIYHE
jgi:hypothetical protein